MIGHSLLAQQLHPPLLIIEQSDSPTVHYGLGAKLLKLTSLCSSSRPYIKRLSLSHLLRMTIYVPCLAALVYAKNFKVSKCESLTSHFGFLTQTSKPVSITHSWVVYSVSEDSSDDM